jgi:hypothetical protein
VVINFLVSAQLITQIARIRGRCSEVAQQVALTCHCPLQSLSFLQERGGPTAEGFDPDFRPERAGGKEFAATAVLIVRRYSAKQIYELADVHETRNRS